MNASSPACATPAATDPWHQATLKTREAASAWWHAFTQPRKRAGAPTRFPEHLDAATLRDIGAPDWMVSRAFEEQERQQQHLLGLRQWRGG